jgi:hypothetical protein
MTNSLLENQSIFSGTQLVSSNGAYFLVVQEDGNLVLYVSSHFVPANAIWNSKTNGRGCAPYKLILQSDGNLVLYDKTNAPLWASNTVGKFANERLIVQNDGNLVLYDGNNKAIWASNTNR